MDEAKEKEHKNIHQRTKEETEKIINAILEDGIRSDNVDYLYIYDLLEVDELFDGLHPNNVGHQKICDKVKTKISKYF